GLERVRFTSPHPAAFTEDVIEAMAETHNVMPQLHMPLQSGSDSILKAMRRSYRAEKYLGILDRVRELIPSAAITTDIIVGFPGETEEDFEATMEVVRKSRFASAFTFQYSKRPGTPAAEMEGQVPQEVVQERYERLLELVNAIAWVTVTVSRAAPYFLVADSVAGSKYELRRTAGGDAWDRSQLESCGAPELGGSKVTLGLPIRTKREL
ncbi:MAG: radical SAM protein, partial [Actinobacteria bacterium]|nr:radical SAM protein [Actinomycetota bacterium]